MVNLARKWSCAVSSELAQWYKIAHSKPQSLQVRHAIAIAIWSVRFHSWGHQITRHKVLCSSKLTKEFLAGGTSGQYSAISCEQVAKCGPTGILMINCGQITWWPFHETSFPSIQKFAAEPESTVEFLRMNGTLERYPVLLLSDFCICIWFFFSKSLPFVFTGIFLCEACSKPRKEEQTSVPRILSNWSVWKLDF